LRIVFAAWAILYNHRGSSYDDLGVPYVHMDCIIYAQVL
jgi:hypothetical protein